MDGLGLFPKKSGNEEEKDVGEGGGGGKGIVFVIRVAFDSN